MRTPSLRARGVLLVALVSFGAGCAGGQSPNPTRNPLPSATTQASIASSPPATAATSASRASAGLLGTYQATLPAVAVPSGATCIFPEGHCAPPAGAWSITISATQLTSVPPSGEYPAQTIVKMSDPNASSGTLEFGPSPLDCIVSTGPAG